MGEREREIEGESRRPAERERERERERKRYCSHFGSSRLPRLSGCARERLLGLESVCSPDPGVDVSLSGGGLKPLATKFGSQGPPKNSASPLLNLAPSLLPPLWGPWLSPGGNLVGEGRAQRVGGGPQHRTGRDSGRDTKKEIELRTTKGTEKEKQRGRRKPPARLGL